MFGGQRHFFLPRFRKHFSSRAERSFKFDKSPQAIRNQGPSVYSPLGIALLSVPVVTFGLGVWQVRRLSWKLDLIAHIEKKTTARPRPLEEALKLGERLDEYTPVTVRGEFDHSREIFVGPRAVINESKNGQSMGGGLMSSGSIGYLVVTPFRLLESGQEILVNRGWVASAQKNAANRTSAQIEGTVTLTGLIRNSEKSQTSLSETQMKEATLTFRDIPLMASLLGTTELLIDADAKSSVPEGPVGGQTRLVLKNDHLSYLITWFSLSGISMLYWLKRFRFL